MEPQMQSELHTPASPKWQLQTPADNKADYTSNDWKGKTSNEKNEVPRSRRALLASDEINSPKSPY